MAICITGGSSGLGRGIAERFARGGAAKALTGPLLEGQTITADGGASL